MDIADLVAPALEYSAKNKDILPGLLIYSQDHVSEFDAVVYDPVICLILQGSKTTTIGDQVTHLRQGDALIVSHDVPVQSKITRASPSAPYVALILSLDLGVIRGLYEQVGHHISDGDGNSAEARSLSSGVAGPDLVQAVSRYLALQDAPVEAAVLGPAVLREIHFRLLMSPSGGMLRRLLSVDSHASRVSRAILKLRTGYNQTLAVADLARTAGMSPSSFHSHFKQVTGTTPLQYQKDLRLIAARDLLRSGRYNVSAVGFEVGYESPTHFSRDYTRKFGAPPSKQASAVTEPA